MLKHLLLILHLRITMLPTKYMQFKFRLNIMAIQVGSIFQFFKTHSLITTFHIWWINSPTEVFKKSRVLLLSFMEYPEGPGPISKRRFSDMRVRMDCNSRQEKILRQLCDEIDADLVDAEIIDRSGLWMSGDKIIVKDDMCLIIQNFLSRFAI